MTYRWRIILLLLVVSGIAGAEAQANPQLDEGPGLAESRQPMDSPGCFLDFVFTKEHWIPVQEDVSLHVIEKFSVRSILRFPRRAILMMPSTFVTNEFYNAQVPADPGYNALQRMAKAGFFAFAVSFEGYGESTLPEDGRIVTFERTLGQMGDLVEWIRKARFVWKVDLMGASIGSNLAVALGGIESPINRRHIGRIVLTSVVYKSFSDFILQNFFTPELEAMLKNAPYVQTAPEAYFLVMSEAEPEALAWAQATFPGVYATGPTLEGFDLPVYPAEPGRAPALQAWGSQDLINTPEDVEQFQNEYGGPVELLVLEGGGHSPLFEPGREEFWRRVLKFLRAYCPFK